MKERVTKHKKAIAIVLAVCLYLALLSLISFVRAPAEYVAVGDSIVRNEDFAVEAEAGRAWADANGLHFRDGESTTKKFSTMVSLKDLQRIQVKFTVDCPEEFAGTAVLHVDLCADGYDTDEQEFTIELKAGQDQVTQMIDKGGSAPEEAQLRLFCLDAAQCDIVGLNVQVLEKIDRTGKTICAAIIAAILLFSLLAVEMVKRSETKGNDHSSNTKA